MDCRLKTNGLVLFPSKAEMRIARSCIKYEEKKIRKMREEAVTPKRVRLEDKCKE